MAATYTPIASITLGATVTSVTFSSIPQTYTDLVLVVQAKTTSTGDVRIRFNGDSGSNYSFTYLTGNGTAASSGRGTNDTSALGNFNGQMTTTLGASNQILHFLNYSNATTNKTILSRGNNASAGVDITVGLWRNTAAVTSITLGANGGFTTTYESGSTFNLYGILGANA
jgi:hypothetical protein